MSTVAAPPPEAASGSGSQSVGAYARAWWIDVKSGELGSLPIFVGLIIIAIVFQTQNDRFLTAGNFVNLIVQTAPYAVIASAGFSEAAPEPSGVCHIPKISSSTCSLSSRRSISMGAVSLANSPFTMAFESSNRTRQRKEE